MTYQNYKGLPEVPGVNNLGGVPYPDNIKQLRSSLCLFSINSTLPETFGLAMVEANAVGRPVLTHPHGALPEVLIDQSQFVNAEDTDAMISRLLDWQNHDPKVTVKEELRFSNIIKEWERILKIKYNSPFLKGDKARFWN